MGAGGAGSYKEGLAQPLGGLSPGGLEVGICRWPRKTLKVLETLFVCGIGMVQSFGH